MKTILESSHSKESFRGSLSLFFFFFFFFWGGGGGGLFSGANVWFLNRVDNCM